MINQFWDIAIILMLINLLEAGRDYCNFMKNKNDGYFPIHNDGKPDFWHDAKKVKQGLYIIGFSFMYNKVPLGITWVDYIWLLIIYVFIILIFQTAFYHSILKKLK